MAADRPMEHRIFLIAAGLPLREPLLYHTTIAVPLHDSDKNVPKDSGTKEWKGKGRTMPLPGLPIIVRPSRLPTPITIWNRQRT